MEVSKPLFDAAVTLWTHVSEKRIAVRDQELALNGTPTQLMEALRSEDKKLT